MAEAGADPLRIAALDAHYGARQVLFAVNLVIPAGRVLAVLGPNGAGKTTLVRAICGRIRPSAGEVRICGRPATARDAQRRIGLAPQHIALYRSLTVRENLEVFARLAGVPRGALAGRIAAVLEKTGTHERADERISRLSGGWQRRANVAAALVGAPGLLVLDEPTEGVDLDARTELAAQVRRLAADGPGVLVVTHDFDHAEQVADHVAILVDGRLVLTGPLKESLAARFGTSREVELTFPRAPAPAQAAELEAAGLIRLGAERRYGGRVPGEARAAGDLLARLESRGIVPSAAAIRTPGLASLYADLVREAAP